MCFTLISSFAQSDFIQLKKKGKVIESWFKGNYIYAQLKNGQWVTALIHNIKDDSLYLRPFAAHVYANRLGLPFIDTTYFGFMTIHFNNLYAFPKEDEGFSYVKNGLIFKIAGGGYILLNAINTLTQGDDFFDSGNVPKLAIATSVLAMGIILGKIHQSNYRIGKKYHIEYISAKPSS